MGDVPQDDVTYNVVIGETVTGGDGDELDHYQVLQYNFKPASIDGSQEGVLRKTENGGVDVEFATGKMPDSRVSFKGQYTPCKEYECILIFDSINSTFRLERLMGIGKGLKVERKDQSRPATSKMVVPLEQDYEAPAPTIPPNRSRAAKTKVIEQPPAAIAGNSPDDGSVSEGGKRRGARKAAPSATKRARKTNPRAAKGVKQPEPAADDLDMEALIDQIESSVPQETTKSDEGEEEDDFLAAAFESENTYQPPVVEPPIPAFPPSHTRPTPIPPHKPAIPPHPSHLPPPPAHHAQTFGFPGTNQNQFQAGMLNGVHGAAPAGPSTTAEESDSGSDSESASDSSSASDSASDSSSESESENE